jgi:hypothetical protein
MSAPGRDVSGERLRRQGVGLGSVPCRSTWKLQVPTAVSPVPRPQCCGCATAPARGGRIEVGLFFKACDWSELPRW